MLSEHLQAKAFIAPPQIYELSRLANFRQYEELKNFSMHREQFGIERWTYYVNGLADGALLALPGDFILFFKKPVQQLCREIPQMTVSTRKMTKTTNGLGYG